LTGFGGYEVVGKFFAKEAMIYEPQSYNKSLRDNDLRIHIALTLFVSAPAGEVEV
jgi:hypothetical protein